MNARERNVRIYKGFCDELYVAAEQAAQAAAYSAETADNVVVVANCMVKESEESAVVAAKLAATLAQSSISEAAELASKSIADSAKTFSMLPCHHHSKLLARSCNTCAVMFALIERASKVANNVLLVAETVAKNAEKRSAESVKLALTASAAAAVAASAASTANAKVKELLGSSKTLLRDGVASAVLQ